MPKTTLALTTSSGTCPAAIFTPTAPSTAKSLPGIIVYMDVWGPRPALDDMCQSIADAGYMVLLPDLFYRHGPYGPLVAATASKNEATRAAAMTRLKETPCEMAVADAPAFLDCLASQGANFPIGIVGYCMGGPRAMDTAAAFPEKIAAVSSLHGAQLAPDDTTTNARAQGLKTCRLYIGSAGVDTTYPPEQSTRLEAALRAQGVDFIMENYPHAPHGWSMTDASGYQPEASARQLKRTLMLLDEVLG